MQSEIECPIGLKRVFLCSAITHFLFNLKSMIVERIVVVTNLTYILIVFPD